MPRLLALEWDDVEARVAVADARQDRVVLQQAFAVKLPATGNEKDAAEIGRTIGEALANRGIKRGTTLVAVGRANIELKNLTLPPSPPEELPEMVRFQAEREFNALGDDWPLDFLPVPSEPGSPQTVLAAAISPELIGEIQATCKAADLSPERLVLRPCGAASLLSRNRPASASQLRLLVDLLADEADLTVLAGDTVVFLRTTRLPVETLQNEPLRALLPEIRRTIAAVHNRFQGQRIEKVFLCGAGEAQEQLVREIGKELDISAELFNPLSGCTLDDSLRRNIPDNPSRFAPLIGMLLDEAAEESRTIDFLNPRRKPEPPTRRQPWMIGAAVAAVLLLGFAWWWTSLSAKDSEIETLLAKLRDLDRQISSTSTAVRQAGQIKTWLADDVDWLDELALVAEKAPPAQDMMLTFLQGTAKDGVGTVNLSGVVRSADVVRDLPRTVADPQRELQLRTTEQIPGSGRYGWTFNGVMRVKANLPEAKAKPVPKTPASESSAQNGGNS